MQITRGNYSLGPDNVIIKAEAFTGGGNVGDEGFEWNSSGGSATKVQIGGGDNIIRLGTSTSATAKAYVGGDATTGYALNANYDIVLKWKINIPTLATVAEDYELTVGFCDANVTSSFGDICAVRYDRSTSANWLTVTEDNNGGEDVNAGSLAVTTGDHIVTIRINGTSSASMYVDGTLIGTTSTALPTTNNVPMQVHLLKTGGTTERTVDVYWAKWKIIG